MDVPPIALVYQLMLLLVPVALKLTVPEPHEVPEVGLTVDESEDPVIVTVVEIPYIGIAEEFVDGSVT